MHRVVGLAAFIAASGCYTYGPLAGPEPQAGNAVRVALNADGTDRVARRLGPRISEIDGKVSVAGTDTVQLLVRVARTADAVESYFKDDTLSIPRTSIASVTQRKLAAGKTAAFAGLVVAGGLAGAAALSGDSGNNTNPPGGGGNLPQ